MPRCCCMKSTRIPPIALLPFALLALVLGILTGLVRLGYPMPVAEAVGQHGALMIGSFLTTLILLERAVVFKTNGALLAPLLNGLSLPAFWLGATELAQGLLVAGALSMVLMTYLFLVRHRHSYYYLLLAGSICLAVGNSLLFRNGFYPLAVPWWIGFLLFTIVGERLELSRFLPLTTGQRAILWVLLALVALGIGQPFHGAGQPVLGAGMLGVALWLLRFDMALKSLRKPGQARYSGVWLLMGYGWLFLSGLLFLLPVRNAFWYDAALHSFFLGFVFSMIFAHAPIILPGVLGQGGVFYHPLLYAWAGLNSVSLGLRLLADWQALPDWRVVSGFGQAAALLGFFATMALTVTGLNRLSFRKKGYSRG